MKENTTEIFKYEMYHTKLNFNYIKCVYLI